MDGFRFKILVLGTTDKLKEEFLSLISQKSWSVDGVSGYVHEFNSVSMDIWFPREKASSKILVDFSHSYVNGVIFVTGRKKRRLLRKFINKIKKSVGNVPYVGVVLRKNMSKEDKALKSLHAIKILAEKMKLYSEEIEVPETIQKKPEPPKIIPGRPIYKIDEFGFVVHDLAKGVPLFVDEPKKENKSKID